MIMREKFISTPEISSLQKNIDHLHTALEEKTGVGKRLSWVDALAISALPLHY